MSDYLGGPAQGVNLSCLPGAGIASFGSGNQGLTTSPEEQAAHPANYRRSSGGSQTLNSHSSKARSLTKRSNREDGLASSTSHEGSAAINSKTTGTKAGRSGSQPRAASTAKRTTSGRARRSAAGSASSAGTDAANLSALQSIAQLIDQQLGLLPGSLASSSGLTARTQQSGSAAGKSAHDDDGDDDDSCAGDPSDEPDSDSSEEWTAKRKGSRKPSGSKPQTDAAKAATLIPSLMSLLEDPETLNKLEKDEDDTAEFENYEGDGRPLEVPVDFGCSDKAIAQAEEWVAQVEANPAAIPEARVRGHPVLAGVRAAHQLLHFNKRIAQKRTLSNTAAFQQIASEPQASVDVALDHFLETAVRSGNMSEATRKKLVAVVRAEELSAAGTVSSSLEMLTCLMTAEDTAPPVATTQPQHVTEPYNKALPQHASRLAGLPSTSTAPTHGRGKVALPTIEPAAVVPAAAHDKDLNPYVQPDSAMFTFSQMAGLDQQVLDLGDLAGTSLTPAGNNELMQSMDSMDLKDLIMDELFPYTDQDGLSVSKALEPLDVEAPVIQPSLIEVDVRAVITTPEWPPPRSRTTSHAGEQDAAEKASQGYQLDMLAMTLDTGPSQVLSTTNGPTTAAAIGGHQHTAQLGLTLHNAAQPTSTFPAYDGHWPTPFGKSLDVGAGSTAAQTSCTLAPSAAAGSSQDAQHAKQHKLSMQEQSALNNLLSSLPPFNNTREPCNRMQHLSSNISSSCHVHPIELQDLAPVNTWLQGNAMNKIVDRFGQAPVPAAAGMPRNVPHEFAWASPGSALPMRTISTYGSEGRQASFNRQASVEGRQELASVSSQIGAWAAHPDAARPNRGKRSRSGSVLQHQLSSTQAQQQELTAHTGAAAQQGAHMPLPALADVMSSYYQYLPGNQPNASTLDGATMQAMLDDLLPFDQEVHSTLMLPRLPRMQPPAAQTLRPPSMTALPPHAGHALHMEPLPPTLNLAGAAKPASQSHHLGGHTADMSLWRRPSLSAPTSYASPAALSLTTAPPAPGSCSVPSASLPSASGQLPRTASGQLPRTASGQLPRTASGQLPRTASGQLPRTASVNKSGALPAQAHPPQSTTTTGSLLAQDHCNPPLAPRESHQPPAANRMQTASTVAMLEPVLREARDTPPKQKPSTATVTVGSVEPLGSPAINKGSRNASTVVSPRSMLSYFLGKDGSVPPDFQPGAAEPSLPSTSALPELLQSALQAASASIRAEEEEEEEDIGDDEDHIIRPHNLRGGEMRKINKALLQQVYHLPINEAAEQLGIGVTVLKKYCRKFEIERWPYRKLKSMDKLIQSVEEQRQLDPTGSSYVLAELQRFKREVYENPEICFDERIKKLRQANFKMEYKQRQALASHGTNSGKGRLDTCSNSQLNSPREEATPGIDSMLQREAYLSPRSAAAQILHDARRAAS